MVPISNIHIDDTGSFIVDSIKPRAQSSSPNLVSDTISSDKSNPNNVKIHSALLHKPVINGGSLTSIDSIQVNKLEVTGTGNTDIAGSVFIGGSLDVHGSVVGTGPYMDSSDIRYKSDILPIKDALKKVCALEGVSFIMMTCDFIVYCHRYM